MTNREYINSLSDDEIAEWISKAINTDSDCGVCPAEDWCFNRRREIYHMTGGFAPCAKLFCEWLKAEDVARI